MSFLNLRRTNTVNHMVTSSTKLPTSMTTLNNSQQLQLKERHSSAGAKKKTIRKQWKAVLNVVTWVKQVQKVRFIVDPVLNGEIDATDLDLELCTVDESAVHYLEPNSKKEMSFCTVERYFWDFVKSNSWADYIRVTEGELLVSIIRTLNGLVKDRSISSYQSVEYTNSCDAMNEFLRRGTLVSVMKRYQKEKTKKKIRWFRFTREYYCKSNRLSETSSLYHPLISTLQSQNESTNTVQFCVQLHTTIEKKQFSENLIIEPKSSISFHEEPGNIDNSVISETSNSKVDTKSKSEEIVSKISSEKQDTSEMVVSEPKQPTIVKLTENKKPTKNPTYFIPRIHSTFKEDTLQCLAQVELTKETITNSLTWHTIKEIVIKKISQDHLENRYTSHGKYKD